NLVNEPNNGGSIELYGGRTRKFEYTAPMDFTGYDVAGISATDDQGETGGMTFIIFDVYGTGLTNILVEPSYISLNQDSVFITADLMGESDGVSVRAHILDEMSSEVTMQDLVANGDNWSTSWAPQSESFFRVDLELVNGTENDTTFYDDIGSFTSVGPLTVSMDGETTVNPGGAIVSSFVVENFSADQGVEDVSVSFQAGSMNCIEGISENLFYLGDIDPSATLSSGGNFFVASLNDDCNSDSTILINVHIYTGEDLYWVDDFTIHIETLGIGDDNVPTFYSLGEAYPNPFNPETRIKYGLIQDGYASLMVHDLMGRKVKTLVSSEKDAGFHSIRWDATNDFGESVSAGMYFYTIQAGEFRDTKKMILLK
ncbi:MAG: T9SS type A sorting domain-containing protein, partial [Candidatus Neomarinimicrobiota bacterium]|nr:T9SS type A sorting domain-containing protein [Candidatus Neomarinimicrobiota bacterium]